MTTYNDAHEMASELMTVSECDQQLEELKEDWYSIMSGYLPEHMRDEPEPPEEKEERQKLVTTLRLLRDAYRCRRSFLGGESDDLSSVETVFTWD